MRLLNKAKAELEDGKIRALLWDPSSGMKKRLLEIQDGEVAWDNGHEHGARAPVLQEYQTLLDGKPVYVFHYRSGSPLRASDTEMHDLDGVSWAILHETKAFGQMGDISHDDGMTLRKVVFYLSVLGTVVGGGFVLYLIVSTLFGGGA